MSLNLTWTIEGEAQLMSRLRNIGEGVKDWTPAFEEASEKLQGIFEDDVFRTEGGAIKEKWAPLKPQYLAQKVKAGFPRDILIRTGAMKSSFYSDVHKDSASIGNNTPYFKYHQSKEPRSKIPRRVMMKIDLPQQTMIIKVFQMYWRKIVLGK